MLAGVSANIIIIDVEHMLGIVRCDVWGSGGEEASGNGSWNVGIVLWVLCLALIVMPKSTSSSARPFVFGSRMAM